MAEYDGAASVESWLRQSALLALRVDGMVPPTELR
jgi:hypothetical protein